MSTHEWAVGLRKTHDQSLFGMLGREMYITQGDLTSHCIMRYNKCVKRNKLTPVAETLFRYGGRRIVRSQLNYSNLVKRGEGFNQVYMLNDNYVIGLV